MTSAFTRVCTKPVGRIDYSNGNGYRDAQMIAAGRTAEELIEARFSHCGGVPAGWSVVVTIFAQSETNQEDQS